MIMNAALFNAFAGPHFDPVFVLTAATSNAHDALLFDVPGLHPAASQAIEDVVAAAGMPGADITLRTLLIEAPAGYGKTHRLTTTLLRCARDGRACPAVLQLSARVDPTQLSRWMLRKLTDELTAGHFRDDLGRTPLQQLASLLWSRTALAHRERFLAALDAEDMDAALQVVTQVVAAIRRSAPELRRNDDPMLCALLLKAEDASADIDIWLRGGAASAVVRGLGLQAIDDEAASQEVIIAIARIAMAVGMPVVLGIDQIEAISRISDDQVLTAVITTALQLVENCPGGLGLVIAALLDTYQTQVRDRIDASFRQRIELGRMPVRLGYVDAPTVRNIVDRRVAVLLDRAGVSEFPHDAGSILVPDWLLAYAESNNLREILQVIREYRQACVEAGGLLDESRYTDAAAPTPVATTATPPTPAPPVTRLDFDKLWADCCDADRDGDVRFSQHEREQLLSWLFGARADELPDIDDVVVESLVLDDAAATPVLDVTFRQAGQQAVERWCVGFADAPNRLDQFANQVSAVITHAVNAYPAVVRTGRIQGVDDVGNPDRPLGHLLRLQAGAALSDLLAAGGRVRGVSDRDWQRLALVRRFYEERGEAVGFRDWCRQRRFLVNHSGVGALVSLTTPGGAAADRHLAAPVTSLAAVPVRLGAGLGDQRSLSVTRGSVVARPLSLRLPAEGAHDGPAAQVGGAVASARLDQDLLRLGRRPEQPMAEAVHQQTVPPDDAQSDPGDASVPPDEPADRPAGRRWSFRLGLGLGRKR